AVHQQGTEEAFARVPVDDHARRLDGFEQRLVGGLDRSDNGQAAGQEQRNLFHGKPHGLLMKTMPWCCDDSAPPFIRAVVATSKKVQVNSLVLLPSSQGAWRRKRTSWREKSAASESITASGATGCRLVAGKARISRCSSLKAWAAAPCALSRGARPAAPPLNSCSCARISLCASCCAMARNWVLLAMRSSRVAKRTAVMPAAV